MISPQKGERGMPDFTVIEGGGPEGRDRVLAEEELSNALYDAAANLLRVIRGAGKPHELVRQFNNVVQASIQFREAFGHGPPSHLLAKILRMHDDVQELDLTLAAGKFTKADIDRKYEDGTTDRMCAESAIKSGALQLIASQFIDQPLQERAGQSQMRDGINEAIKAKAKIRAYWSAKYPSSAKPCEEAQTGNAAFRIKGWKTKRQRAKAVTGKRTALFSGQFQGLSYLTIIADGPGRSQASWPSVSTTPRFFS
jgi:hypothetical protein